MSGTTHPRSCGRVGRTLRGLLPIAALALLLAGVVAPGSAAASSSTSGSPTAPATEHVTLKLSGPGGHPLFAPVGGTAVVVYGRVTPYVAGQRTAVAFFLGGRQIGTKALAVSPRSGGSGSFQVRFPTRYAGTVTAVVGVHVGPGDVVSARTPAIQYVHTDISPDPAERRSACCSPSSTGCTTRYRSTGRSKKPPSGR